MHAPVDGGVHSLVKCAGLATSEGHVRYGALVRGLACLTELLLGCVILLLGCLCGPDDTANDVGHGSGTVRAENLHSDDVCRLGNTVFAAGNGTRAVGTVTVAVLIDIVLGHGVAPERTALELNMVDVDTGVNDVNVNTLTTPLVEEVLGEGGESETVTVGDTSETLRNTELADCGLTWRGFERYSINKTRK